MDGKSLWIVKRSFSLPQRSTEDNFTAINWINFGLAPDLRWIWTRSVAVSNYMCTLQCTHWILSRYTSDDIRDAKSGSLDRWRRNSLPRCARTYVPISWFTRSSPNLIGREYRARAYRTKQQAVERLLQVWTLRMWMVPFLTAHQRPSKTNTYTVVQNQQAQLIDS